jgi:hypothetical protein
MQDQNPSASTDTSEDPQNLNAGLVASLGRVMLCAGGEARGRGGVVIDARRGVVTFAQPAATDPD